VSTRARLAVATAVAVVSAAGIAILVVHWVGGDPRAAVGLGLRETDAVAPFAGYREVRMSAGGPCARVVVADTAARRERGLRDLAVGRAGGLGPYAGMLFVQSSDSEEAFTMAGVGRPLDITWYAADGSRVDSARMRPCPRRRADQCPPYRSRRPYRLALETLPRRVAWSFARVRAC
jgi:uncharacterized membrane protein (UPF0127 family)